MDGPLTCLPTGRAAKSQGNVWSTATGVVESCSKMSQCRTRGLIGVMKATFTGSIRYVNTDMASPALPSADSLREAGKAPPPQSTCCVQSHILDRLYCVSDCMHAASKLVCFIVSQCAVHQIAGAAP